MNIFSTIAMLFTTISKFISAIGRLGNAADEYCKIAESHATITHDQYVLEAAKVTAALKAQLNESKPIKTSKPKS
jgi:hypothetical protein